MTNLYEAGMIYKVVRNQEEQYSLWLADRENALGWTDVGPRGTEAECLASIQQVWVDMRPLSLRPARAESQGPRGQSSSGEVAPVTNET